MIRAVAVKAVFWSLLLLLLAHHVLIFFVVNLGYLDSDQPYMWIGAFDYARGLFPEPRYYGQDYNTFLEALVAVPFMKLGMAVYHAVPLATHIIFLFPVVFTVVYLYRRRMRLHAILITAMYLCMPAEFDIITSIPRGFITGLLFTALYVISILEPRNLRWAGINTMLGVAAYFVHSNTLIVTGPFMVYLFLSNRKEKRYYIVTACALLFALPMYLLLDLFYARHPEYVVHGLQMDFRPSQIIDNLPVLLDGLRYVTPASTGWTWFWPAVFVCMMLAARRDQTLLLTLVSLLALSLLMLAAGKVNDATHWAFFSFGRFFVGIPVIMTLLLARMRMTWEIPALAMACLAATSFVLKAQTFPADVARHTDNKTVPWFGVHLIPLKEALHAIQFYKNVCRQYGTNTFVVSNGFWLNTFLVYGGKATDTDYPYTIETLYEKRLYIKQTAHMMHAKRLVLLAEDSEVAKMLDHPPLHVTKLDDYGLLLVDNNPYDMNAFTTLVRETEWKLKDIKRARAK